MTALTRRLPAPWPALLWASLTWATAPAGAASVVGEAPPTTSPAATRPATQKTPTLDLASGVITAVDAEHRRLTLSGQRVEWHPTNIKVVAHGAVVPTSRLQPGQRVRFAMEPGAPASARRVVLIYLDGQP